MQYTVAIGERKQSVEIPEELVLAVLEQNEVQVELTGADAVSQAINNPIGSPKLEEIIKPGEKIAIITSDLTRPIPSYIVLPPLLERLRKIGCANEDIVIVFALGSHRKQTEAEMRKLVGDQVYDNYRCEDGDIDDVVHMGTTSSGTPVDVCRTVAEADRRICLGNIEYHYFAGYSGGAKAIMPGVSTRAAIQANHSMMVRDTATTGNVDHNPVRDDLEEAINYCPIDFIVNVVLDEHKKIIHAVAGHFITAHRSGCKFLDSLYLKPIAKRADIVICSQGGKPKDLNLYQTQKALDNAKNAVRDGGIIILVGSCQEGLGEGVFERWMLEHDESSSMISDIQKHFELGGHKAAAIAMVLQRARIFLVSDMEHEFVRRIFMTPFNTVQEAYDQAKKELGEQSEVIIMPYGGSTLPRCLADKDK